MIVTKIIRSFCINAQKAAFEALNQTYKEHRQNQFRIYRPKSSQDYHVNPDTVAKQHKSISQEVNTYIASYKYDHEFDCKAFIKLLGKVSYVYDNTAIVNGTDFHKLLKDVAEQAYLFKDQRDIALFINFCSLNNINDPDLWFSLTQQVRNHYKKLDNQDKLLVLQALNNQNRGEIQEFFTQFESYFLEDIQQHNNHKLISQVLEVYRHCEQGSENFYYTIKMQILKQLDDLKIDEIIRYLQHYGLHRNEIWKDQNEVLNAIMVHLYKVMRFLNKKQLLQMYYIYVKTNIGSPILYKLVEERVALLVDEMQLIEIEQLLIIAANQRNSTIFMYVEGLLTIRMKDSRPSDLVQIAVLYMENNLGSVDFKIKLEQHLIPAINVVVIDELHEFIWALIQNEKNLHWMEKIAESLTHRVEDMHIKLLTSLVWMTSDYFKNLPNKAKQQSKLLNLYDKIENKLITKFETYEATPRDCALVFSAYTRNLPISKYLIDLMEIYMLNSSNDELLEFDGWALSQIVWGFSQLSDYDNLLSVLNHLLTPISTNLEEMNLNELLVSLRVYVEQKLETEEMMVTSIEKANYWVTTMSLDQVYLSIHVFTNTRHVNSPNLEELLKKLEERSILLKSVVSPSGIDEQVNEYLLNEEIYNLKQ